MADIFESNVQSESALEVLVGEGKKFADAEALARAKIEADRTVADRNRELEENRQEQARLREEILALKSQVREPVVAQETPRVADRPVEEEPNKDLASRIREELNQVQAQEKRDQNAAAVRAKMLELYGSADKAREVITNRATELGVSPQWLADVAAQSPNAFYAQLGLDVASPTPVASRSDVNSAAVANASSAVKAGTYKFYEEIRKSDPRRYFSPQVQNAIFADRKRLGEAFYQ